MPTTDYTAVVASTGDGRFGGRATSTDGQLDLVMGIPAEVGGNGEGTNPEQLFAAGWAGCFHSAVKLIASQRKIPVQDSAVVAEVTLHQDPVDGFSLSGVIRLELTGVTQQVAEDLAEAAHQTCPYSKATRGNIQVTVEADAA